MNDQSKTPETDALCEWLADPDRRFQPHEKYRELRKRLLKLELQRNELLEALKGVVRVADRDTTEFNSARAAIASVEGGER